MAGSNMCKFDSYPRPPPAIQCAEVHGRGRYIRYPDDPRDQHQRRQHQQHQPRFQYYPPPPPHIRIPPEDPVRKKQRKCLYAYYILRQAALVVSLILVILDVNIYVSRRGSYLDEETRLTSPVYNDLWLTAPLSALVCTWACIGFLCSRRRKDSPGGGIGFPVQFGVELLLTLGAAVCLVFMVLHIADKQAAGVYTYPYFRYEVPMVCLLGLLIVIQSGLVARAFFEVTLEKRG